MPYSEAQIRAMVKGDLAALAPSLGNGEGGSRESQHQAAIDFWRAALAFTGEDALTPENAALAEAEIARHERAIAPPEMSRYSLPPYHRYPV